MFTIIETGNNLVGDRLIQIEVQPDSRLFKLDEERLPLFAGRSNALGTYISASERSFLRVEYRRPEETERQYMDRIGRVGDKYAQLNRWILTIASRNKGEDAIIINQLRLLEGLEQSRFDEVLRYANFPCFADDHQANPALAVENIVESLSFNPQQVGYGAVRFQELRTPPGQALGLALPPELEGFGIRIHTWDYAQVHIAWNGSAYLYSYFFVDPSVTLADLLDSDSDDTSNDGVIYEVSPIFFQAWDKAPPRSGPSGPRRTGPGRLPA